MKKASFCLAAILLAFGAAWTACAWAGASSGFQPLGPAEAASCRVGDMNCWICSTTKKLDCYTVASKFDFCRFYKDDATNCVKYGLKIHLCYACENAAQYSICERPNPTDVCLINEGANV